MNNQPIVDVQLRPVILYILELLPTILLIIITVWIYNIIKKNNQYIDKLIIDQNDIIDKFKAEISKNNHILINEVKHTVYSTHHTKASYSSLFDLFYKIKNITKNDLYDTMLNSKACRAAIYLFHNGTKTPNGLNFLKVSCIADRTVIGSGVKEKTTKHSNLAINLFDEMYMDLIVNGKCLILRNDPNTMNSTRSEFISAEKIQYSQAICIYDADNNALGFLLAEFEHGYIKNVADNEYQQLKILADKLVPIFSITDYVNITSQYSNESSEKNKNEQNI